MLIEHSHKNALRLVQFTPSLILFLAMRANASILGGWALQAFYLGTSLLYIHFFSKYHEITPFLLDQLRFIKKQVRRGFSLGISAFLLIVLYSHIILRHRSLLPDYVEFSIQKGEGWWLIILLLLNPVMEEWFWRVFLAKTISSASQLDRIASLIAYLCLHWVLFSHVLGIKRAIFLTGTFFSIGRSMQYIKDKEGIICAVITHYGVTGAGVWLMCVTTSMLAP